MNKKVIAMLTIASLFIVSTGCSNKEASSNKTSATSTVGVDTTITLGDTIDVDGEGVVVEKNKVTINSSGTYSISGTLRDGQIEVNAGDEDNVQLILNGVNITNSTSSGIYVANSKNTYVILEDGTSNEVTDGENYIFEDTSTDEPNAAIFSKSDLFISGTGSLKVNAKYNNGITSKDDLEIADGTISIDSVADGIRGRDSITISSGNIIINSQGDGMKSNNDEDTEKGYVLIEGGTINITSGEDGIQAETVATITGGDITINSVDDSIHSNDKVEINGGTINIKSGDDGIHADSIIDINNGDITIAKSYEGIEAETININNGNIKVTSSDDGVNASGGNDGSSINGRPGQNNFASAGKGTININGGKIVVDASGDGLDANGSIYMKDGTVIVNGPEDNGNGSLDYDGEFQITGGLLIAAGSSGMAQSPSEISSQNSINIFSAIQANTIVRVEDSNGNEVVTFAPSKNVQSLVISSANIKIGETYNVYTGGTSTGSVNDGIYSEGSYLDGTELESFTVSGVVTNIGEVTGGFGGSGAGMQGQGGGFPGGERPTQGEFPGGEMPARP